MLQRIPQYCQNCRAEISDKIGYGEGLVQLRIEVHGFNPFKMEGWINFDSTKCFNEWFEKNKSSFNVEFSFEENCVEAESSLLKEKRKDEHRSTSN